MAQITDFDIFKPDSIPNEKGLVEYYAFFRVNGHLIRKRFLVTPDFQLGPEFNGFIERVCQGWADKHGANYRYG